MAFEAAICSNVDVSMNEKALRLVDPSLCTVHEHAKHVVLYSFKPDTNEWEKVNIEGALFIYSRKVEPLYKMTIVNRLNTNNFIEEVNGNINLEVQEPFLLYRNGDGQIFGIWFYDKKDCGYIAYSLNLFINKLSRGKNDVEKIMSLSENRARRVNKVNDVKIPDGTSKRVLDFFAMAKNSIPFQPPGANQQPPGAFKRSDPIKIKDDAKPLLQRLLSNPNQPVQTVEQIEKHLSNTPKKENFPIEIKSPRDKKLVNRPRSLIVSKSVGSAMDRQLENGLGFVRIKESSVNSDSPPGEESLDRPGSSCMETPNKVPLFTPNMFLTSKDDSESQPQDTTSTTSITKPDISLDIRPEPLTKAQLLQAVSYLLKNDPDFVHKLHEAYVKSFVDHVS